MEDKTAFSKTTETDENSRDSKRPDDNVLLRPAICLILIFMTWGLFPGRLFYLCPLLSYTFLFFTIFNRLRKDWKRDLLFSFLGSFIFQVYDFLFNNVLTALIPRNIVKSLNLFTAQLMTELLAFAVLTLIFFFVSKMIWKRKARITKTRKTLLFTLCAVMFFVHLSVNTWNMLRSSYWGLMIMESMDISSVFNYMAAAPSTLNQIFLILLSGAYVKILCLLFPPQAD